MLIEKIIVHQILGQKVNVYKLKVVAALAGNRTRVSRVTGKNSTTEPPMFDIYILFYIL